jgi:hypothetical protein
MHAVHARKICTPCRHSMHGVHVGMHAVVCSGTCVCTACTGRCTACTENHAGLGAWFCVHEVHARRAGNFRAWFWSHAVHAIMHGVAAKPYACMHRCTPCTCLHGVHASLRRAPRCTPCIWVRGFRARRAPPGARRGYKMCTACMQSFAKFEIFRRASFFGCMHGVTPGGARRGFACTACMQKTTPCMQNHAVHDLFLFHGPGL